MWLYWLIPLTAVIWAAGWLWRLADSRKQIKEERIVRAMAQLSVFGNSSTSVLEVAEMLPDTVVPLLRWVDLATDAGDHIEAVRRAEIVRQKFPKEPNGYTAGAGALLRAGRRADAESLLENGIRKFGKIPILIRALANLAYDAGDRPLAAARFAQLRKLFPEERDGYTWGADAEAANGNHDVAEALLKTAIEGPMALASERSLACYAQYAMNRRDWTEAARRWAVLCERVPMKSDGYLAQSEALRRAGQWEKAGRLLESAKILFPKDARVDIEAGHVARRVLAAGFAHESARIARLAPPHSQQEATETTRMDTATLPETDLQRALAAAANALAQGDTNEAQRQWSVARECPDAPVEAWVLAAAHTEPDAAFTLLREASARFTGSARAHHDLGRAANRRGDWKTAEAAWRAHLAVANQHWWAFTELAAALRELGRLDDAESVLIAGGERHPDEPMPAIERARLTQRRGKWEASFVQWDNISARWPERWEGPLGRGIALSQLQRENEAYEALIRVTQRFPDRPEAFANLARIAERRQDWPAAEQWWRGFIGIEPAHWWAHADLAGALQRQTRTVEAEAVLATAMERFPTETRLLASLARLAEARQDWPEALRRWEVAAAHSPDEWTGYRGQAAALRAMARTEEADALILAQRDRFSSNTDALHDLGRLAERKRDWPGAEKAWRGFLARESRTWWAYTALARVLCEQGNVTEADAVLRDAAGRLPDEAGIAIDLAKLSEVREAHAEAAAWWQVVARLRPKAPDGAIGESAALRCQGAYADADTVVQAALRRLPDEPGLYDAYGLNALAQGQWAEALTRFRAGQARFPSYDVFRQRVYELQLRLADAGESITTPPVDDGAEANRSLVLQFESLGGGGHGCEFGIFQRSFGAEPLGLLRWADIYQDALSEALETDLAGVGDPEFTNIFVPASSGRPEYWTTDRRYHMAMRTFVHTDEAPLDRMTRQVTKRLGFLRGKLIADLSEGTKIFVYKNMKRNLTEAELDRLYNAVHRYGDNTLLYIRYEDAEHPNGTVQVDRPGLMIGFIDHFSHTPDTDTYIGPATEGLLRICKTAHALWQDGRASNPSLISPIKPDQRLPQAVTDAIEPQPQQNDEASLPVESHAMGWERMAKAHKAFEMLAALKNSRAFDKFEAEFQALPDELRRNRGIMSLWCDVPRMLRDWTESLKRADAMDASWPGNTQTVVSRIHALSGLHGYGEAVAQIDNLVQQNRLEPSVLAAAAEVAVAARDHERVIAHCNRIRAIGDRHFGPGLRHCLAEALYATGQIEAAAAEILAGLRFHPGDRLLKADAQRWRIPEPDPEPDLVLPKIDHPRSSHVVMKNASDIEAATGLTPKDLVLHFETIGENCEFGFIQRAVGAEPISLMRFAGMRWEEMALALNTGFEGIDGADNLIAEAGETSWDIRDRRYNIAYHTFLPIETTPEDRLLKTQSRRLRWLADKLIDDLRSGDKILLAWRAREDADQDFRPLVKAVRRYGNANLVIVSGGAGDPGVEEIGPGLFRGRVGWTRMELNGNKRDVQGWLAMLGNAWLLINAGKAAASPQ